MKFSAKNWSELLAAARCVSGGGAANLAAAAFLVLFVFLKLPHLPLDFFWDEVIVYANPARLVYENGFREIFPHLRSDKFVFYGHPPAYSASIALAYHAFGSPEAYVARGFTLFLAVAGLAATHLLVSKRAAPWAGFSAMALLALQPSYFVQSVQVLADVATMCLFPALFYLAAAGKFRAYAVAGIYTVLCKETTLAPLVAIPLVKLLADRRLPLREFVCLLAPAFAIAAYFSLEKLATGSFSHWPALSENLALTPEKYFANLRDYTYGELIALPQNSIFFYTAFGGAAFSLLSFRNWRRHWVEFAALLTVFFFFLGKSFFSPKAEHYFIPIQPILIFTSVIFLWRFGRLIRIGIPLLVPLIWFELQRPAYYSQVDPIGYGFEPTLEFADVIRVNELAFAYIERHHPNAVIHAEWPIDASLLLRRYGQPNLPHLIARGERRDFDVLVLAEASARVGYDRQLRLIREERLVLEKELTVNGRKVSIFRSPEHPAPAN